MCDQSKSMPSDPVSVPDSETTSTPLPETTSKLLAGPTPLSALDPGEVVKEIINAIHNPDLSEIASLAASSPEFHRILFLRATKNNDGLTKILRKKHREMSEASR